MDKPKKKRPSAPTLKHTCLIRANCPNCRTTVNLAVDGKDIQSLNGHIQQAHRTVRVGNPNGGPGRGRKTRASTPDAQSV